MQLFSLLAAATLTLALSVAACGESTPVGTDSGASPRGTITLADAISVYDADASTGSLRKRFGGIMPFRLTSGETIVRRGTNLIEIDAQGFGERVILESRPSATRTHTEEFNMPRVSPDGNLIAYAGKYLENAYVVRRSDGSLVATFDGYNAPTWMPDGRLVLAGADGSGLSIARIGTGEPVSIAGTPRNATSPSVSPDGARIAFTVNESLWLSDIDGAGSRQLVDQGEFRSPTWSPDGKWVAVIYRGMLDLVPVGGGEIVEYRFEGSGIDGVHEQLTWR